ncbi:MAG: histidine--tRNA ligase [Candidatus Omnitrophota bacterium]
MVYKAPRGTSDILGTEVCLWNKIFQTSREIFKLFGFTEIITPIFEDSRLFIRSLGDTSEIVTKQMLNIQTKEKSLTLRPEGTASIIRAYLEHHLDKGRGFTKLFYIGPMFRGERPQKGRLRQFNHIGAEAIGSYSPALDAEMLVLITRLLEGFGISGYEINLNSVGCQKDKEKLKGILKKELENKKSGLCEDCRSRLKKNVLRILDCKNEACRDLVQNLDFQLQFRCSSCSSHFEQVKEHLSRQDIKFKELPYLVRGLDYYTGTVFEINHAGLGSQDALGAGGRYDNLVKELGGPDLGAVGFALGVERLIIALESQARDTHPVKQDTIDVFVVVTKDEFLSEGLLTLAKLRNNKICADIDYTNRSLKAQMRRANNENAHIVAILGEDEVKADKVSLKDMQTGKQETYPSEQLIDKVKELLK